MTEAFELANHPHRAKNKALLRCMGYPCQFSSLHPVYSILRTKRIVAMHEVRVKLGNVSRTGKSEANFKDETTEWNNRLIPSIAVATDYSPQRVSCECGDFSQSS